MLLVGRILLLVAIKPTIDNAYATIYHLCALNSKLSLAKLNKALKLNENYVAKNTEAFTLQQFQYVILNTNR